MDIREYNYIMAVVKSGNITEAANELFISQPSLSVYIKKLENRIGLTLFHRVDGKIQLTYAGRKYVEYAQKIIDLDNELMRELDDIKNLTIGEVVLGMPAVRGEAIFPKLLSDFGARHPGMKVKLIEGSAFELEEMVKNRTVDLAIFNQYHELVEFEYTELFTEHICVAIPSDDPVCDKAVILPNSALAWIDLACLKEHPFILLKKGQRLRQIADDLFSKAGYQPVVYNETENSKTAYNLSLAGMGITFLQDSFMKRENHKDIRFFLVGEPVVASHVVIAHLSGKKLSDSANALLAMISEIDFGSYD